MIRQSVCNLSNTKQKLNPQSSNIQIISWLILSDDYPFIGKSRHSRKPAEGRDWQRNKCFEPLDWFFRFCFEKWFKKHRFWTVVSNQRIKKNFSEISIRNKVSLKKFVDPFFRISEPGIDFSNSLVRIKESRTTFLDYLILISKSKNTFFWLADSKHKSRNSCFFDSLPISGWR